MTPVVILDAHFLSSFLKIDQMSLIRDFYQDAKVLVPPAVYREVSQTDLVPQSHGYIFIELSMESMEGPASRRRRKTMKEERFRLP